MKPRCDLCDLAESCKSVKIDGRGSAERPTYLFVGQNPGQQEDQQNQVFVGPVGQLLMKAIKEYDLKPARLTNAVRCATPQDKAPNKGELAACRPYLMQEIRETKPKLIVALGNTALRSLTGKSGIMKYAGQVVGEINGSKVFGMYHPSFVLRYPANLHRWEMHFKELKHLLNGQARVQVEVKILNPAEAVEWLKACERFVTFDLETSSLKPHEGGIKCIGFSNGKEQVVVSRDQSPQAFDKMMEFFLGMDNATCAYNHIFDLKWLMAKYGQGPAKLIYDPMLLAYLLDENTPLDLETTASRILEARPWKATHELAEGETWDSVPFERLAQHCGEDCYYTHALMEKMFGLLRAAEGGKGLSSFYQNILMKTARMCALYELQGLKVDKAYAFKVTMEFKAVNMKIEKELAEMPLVQKLVKHQGKPLNLNSAQQVSKIIYKGLKLKCEKQDLTEGGLPSVKKEVLLKHKGEHPFIDLYLEWNDNETLIGSYLEKFPAMTDDQDLIHPSYNPAFQVTARVSVSDPPAANVPGDKQGPKGRKVRGIIASRFPGGSILSADYSQLEMRLLASESGDTNMIEIFSKGGDLHDETAKLMFGGSFSKEQRSIAKNINFGTVYGISSWSLAKKFRLEKTQAAEFISNHKKTFPAIYTWMADQHRFIHKHGWVQAKLGNMRHLPRALKAQDEELQGIFRQAGNFPIQTLGACINNLSAYHIWGELQRYEGAKSKVIHQVHDSIIIDAVPQELDSIRQIAKKVMEEAVPEKYAPFLKVPLQVDFEIGERWGVKS